VRGLKRWILKLLPLLALAVLCVQQAPAVCDRCIVPVEPGVDVYEPGQKAIIAWNGTREDLILWTDVEAPKRETKVLEFMPLPSEPVIEEASVDSFMRAAEVLSSSFGVRWYSVVGARKLSAFEVEVVVHRVIGPHNITVVRAEDVEELVGWVEAFLDASGVEFEPGFLASVSGVVEHYLSMGMNYFVLDIVTVEPGGLSVKPVLYSFETDRLYYPLVVSTAVEGWTDVTLFVITEGKIPRYEPFQTLASTAVTREELKSIDDRLVELFDSDHVWLTGLTWSGPTSELDRDLVVESWSLNEARRDALSLCSAYLSAAALFAFSSALLIRALRGRPRPS